MADARFSRNELFRLDNTKGIKDRIEGLYEERTAREQFCDFAVNAPFRESIVTKKGRKVRDAADLELLKSYRVSASFRPVQEESGFGPGEDAELSDLLGQTIFVSDPVLKVALSVLGEGWPRMISFDELLKEIIESGKAHVLSEEVSSDHLLSELVSLYRRDLLTFSCCNPPLSSEVFETPAASPFAAIQARSSSLITNLRYETVELDNFEKELLKHTDGTKTKDELIEILLKTLEERGGVLKEDGAEISDPTRKREIITSLCTQGLETLKMAGLLRLESGKENSRVAEPKSSLARTVLSFFNRSWKGS